MNKYKPSIAKKKLSWENKDFNYECDEKNCKELGKYRAPKSRSNLNNYYFFCLKHVKEYNKSWDFYKGLTVDQIENSMREDTIWNRPSWPLKGAPHKVIEQIKSFFNDEYDELNPKDNFSFNKETKEVLSHDENDALKVLELNLPLNLDKIKKNYKKLVKIFHPDVNGNNKNAEEKFKEINKSYKILLQKFKNEQQI